MRFLSLYGTDGFRTFLGVLNGKLPYTPAKIPTINPEILTERDYDLRLEAVIAPFTDNHPSLKNILPIISEKIGTLHTPSPKYSTWKPQYHLSYLGQLLMAAFREELQNEQSDTLSFFATHDDDGSAFTKAFALEQKTVYIPQDQTLPTSDNLTKYISYDTNDSNFIKNINKQSNFRVDQHNIVRILGHMSTIIEALYHTETTRQRFYNDPVSIVISGDSMEYILAAYYLSKSAFPIKNIHVVSQQQRMVHQFIQKGELKLSQKQLFESFEFSLDRMLFELARGSSEKVVLWKKELISKGSFNIDSTSFQGLKLFQSHMATPAIVEQIRSSIENSASMSTLELFACHLAQTSKEHVLALEIN